MCPNMVRKHGKFNGDWTIGGAITIKKVFLLGVQAQNMVNQARFMVNHTGTW